MAVQQKPQLQDDPARTVAMVDAKWNESKTANDNIKQAWLTCIAFYLGRHYVYYEPVVQALLDIPNFPSTKAHRARLKEIRNHIAPLVNMWCALATETSPVFTARPKSGDERDAVMARTATHALEHTAYTVNLEWKLAIAAKWTCLAGTSFLLPYWDGAALQGQGNFGLEVVSPFDGFPEVGAATEEDCQWFIRTQSMHIDRARQMFPEMADQIVPDTQWQMDRYAGKLLETIQNTGYSSIKDRVILVEYRHKRGSEYPDGRYIIKQGGVVLADRAFPSDKLGVYPWFANIVTGRYFARSFVVDELSPQRTVNDNASRLREWVKNNTGTCRLIAEQARIPEGAFTGEGMENVPYTSFGGDPVKYLQPPDMPTALFKYMSDEIEGMANIANIHDASRGSRAPGERSARQIAYRQAADARSLAEPIKSLNLCLKNVGRDYLEMWRTLVPSGRAISYLGNDSKWQTETFYEGDIDADLETEVGSLAPRNRAVEEDAARADFAAQIIDRDEVRKALRYTGHMETVYDNPDRVRAQAENQWLLQGQPVEIKPHEDHQVHWSEHRLAAVTDDYYNAPPEIQAVMDAHIAQHSDRLQAEATQTQGQSPSQPEKPKGQSGGNPDLQGGGGQNWGLDMAEEQAQGQL